MSNKNKNKKSLQQSKPTESTLTSNNPTQKLEPELVKSDSLPSKTITSEFTVYSGPIPPPSHFLEYEKVLPGLANRIMTQSESQSAHRIKIEKRVVYFDSFNLILGNIFAFLIVIAGMISGTILIMHDKNGSGFAAIIAPLVTVTGIFLRKKKTKVD